MNFSQREIELARRFRQQRLQWIPRAGHYVYDETGFCKQTSPFQENVFFILNYDYFIRTVGGVEKFIEIMTWLPTWADLWQLLRKQGVTNAEVALHLIKRQSIEVGTERESLYELLDEVLTKQAS